jgi:Zn-finger nucleic acid-binding protein
MSCPKCKAPLEGHTVADGVVVHHCPSCFGVLYGKDTLTVPLQIVGLSPSKAACPNCAKPMETGTAYEKAIEVDSCGECGSIWFDAGEIQILRRLTGVENVAGKPGSEKPKAVEKEKPQSGLKSGPLAKKTGDEPAQGKSLQPRDMSGVKNPDADRAPTVEYEGRVYEHFQTSLPTTTAVLGEFPWTATVGDVAKMRDFICPPRLLSQEVTSTESVWTHGEYVEPEEIWTSFGMPGNPPPKSGVGPAQPNPWAGRVGAMWGWFFLAAAACLGSFILAGVVASGATVFSGGFEYKAGDPEKSRVTDVFEIPGRVSNLEVTVDTNLDNKWAFVSMALIDADTDVALDFGREVSYYRGFEDGESWSEGASFAKVIVPRVPPGRYYLRVEPETDSPALSYRISIKRDVPLARIPLLAILLLLLPVVWSSIRQSAFETERWTESDHPRVSDEDWEDDE